MVSYIKEKCRSRRCENRFSSTPLGVSNAKDDGWIMLKNGRAFCPGHIPDWFLKAQVLPGGGERD